MLPSLSIALATVLCATPATLALDTAGKKSVVSYHAVHKLHQFTGVSHDLQGAARILPDGTVQVQIRSPVAAFDSDNGNRDEHMKETVEAAKFPDVIVKCLAKITDNVSQKTTADCDVNLHGQSEKVEVPLSLTFSAPTTVRATGAFSVSWDGFGIKRPQLLFVPIDDKGDIAFDLSFAAK